MEHICFIVSRRDKTIDGACKEMVCAKLKTLETWALPLGIAIGQGGMVWLQVSVSLSNMFAVWKTNLNEI